MRPPVINPGVYCVAVTLHSRAHKLVCATVIVYSVESIIYLTSKFQTKMILWTHGVSTVTYLDNGYTYVRA